jgi:uncharacterized tellurite resistance protein B-like protein
MIGGLKALLFGNTGEENVAAGGHGDAALHHAAAGLLVEAAMLDGHFHDAERQRIENLLTERFDVEPSEVSTLMEAAEAAAVERVELHTITKTVRDHFDDRERIAMIEMLWDVVYADGELDDFESNMMRRVSGLLYVSDRESGDARKRAVERLKG